MTPASKLLFRALRIPLVFAVTAGAISCVFHSAQVTPLDVRHAPTEVTSPVKAHLVDGSTVLYPTGVRIANNTLITSGSRYALGTPVLSQSGPIPLDSVVGMESYDTKINMGKSVAATGAAIAVGVPAAALLAVAIFGSCPTFYTDSASAQVLQAEGFSYSIAPLFEQRDVDRLHSVSAKDGRVVLHVRNEALETHYINHLELIDVRHEAGELALPDQSGRPIALSGLSSVFSVRDRAGRDLAGTVRNADGVVFSTADQTLRAVSAADLDDYINIAFPAPRGGDSVAIVLNMRNSLLNTVLLYEQILAAPGARSLDWLGGDLGHISTAIDMGRWYATRMGMRISVRENGRYVQVARIGDSGPIAFHDVAVLVPARSDDDSVRVRLSFVADDWRIDVVRVASGWRRPETHRVPTARVAMYDPSQNTAALSSIRDADDGYLITTPGQSFAVDFDAGDLASGARTFMLASQGYYTEWVRGSWIRNASGKTFTPSDEAITEAIRSWRSKQSEMERHFYSTRISSR